MELLFLGTGSGVPSKHRNVSSVALKMLNERNCVWLFDCGEATQHQILHTTLKPAKIEKIFIQKYVISIYIRYFTYYHS